MSKAFASHADLSGKRISFTEVGRDLWAFTAEADPNSGVIIGDDRMIIVEAQATPHLAHKVIEKVCEVTDEPISHLVLTHHHAVRVLGASTFDAPQIIMSEKARAVVAERGKKDWDSEFSDYAIDEHCLPFNVARAYDEALDIDTARIWTDKRDVEMWEQLQS